MRYLGPLNAWCDVYMEFPVLRMYFNVRGYYVSLQAREHYMRN